MTKPDTGGRAGEAGRTALDWIEYELTRPEAEGIYEWQIPSRPCKNMIVRVLARFRKRGAGYTSVISPEFDHWDGYKVHVPAGTKWRQPSAPGELKPYRQELLCVEELEPVACPFCNRVPTVKGVCRAVGGGVVVTDDANTFNSWWFECCSWARTPHYADPRQLETARRAALSAKDGR